MLENTSFTFLNQKNLFDSFTNICNKNNNIILAVSGGVDSLALLYAFLPFKNFVKVVHVDHSQREESFDQSKFLAGLFCKLGFRYKIIKLDVEKGLSEAKLREERYKALFSAYPETTPTVITGHHMDDQLETILMGIKRGNRSSCLEGMPQKSYLVFESLSGFVYRPFLELSKNELKEFLINQNALNFVQEDSSNNDNNFTRNSIRNLLIPELISKHGIDRLYKLCHKAKQRRQRKNDLLGLSEYGRFFYFRQKFVVIKNVRVLRYLLEHTCLIVNKKLPSTTWLISCLKKYNNKQHFSVRNNNLGVKYKYNVCIFTDFSELTSLRTLSEIE